MAGVGTSFQKDVDESFNGMDNVYTKRYRDVIGFAGSVSIADTEVFRKPNLFLLELKTSAGISISISEKYKTYNKTKNGHKKGDYVLDDNGDKIITHYGRLNNDQIKMMLEASKVDGLYVGYLMEFRKADKCFYISVSKVLEFINDPSRDRKSIPVEFLEDNGLLLPRTIKSTIWLESEQELILNEVGKGYTGNEVVSKLKDKLPNRNDSSIKSKFYQLKKTKKIKPVNQYIHYEYNENILDMIIEYEESEI